MKPQLLLALAGNPGSGKTELSKHLVAEHGFRSVRGSAILAASAHTEGITLTDRESYDAYHRQSRAKYGRAFLTSVVLDLHEPRVVFDGIRNFDDFVRFKQAGGHVAALWCSQEDRYAHRFPTFDELNLTPQQFAKEEQSEHDSDDPAGSHTVRIMQMADYHLDSSRPLEIVRSKLDFIIADMEAAH